MVRITKQNVALATLTMTLLGSNINLGLLGEHNLVLAAKKRSQGSWCLRLMVRI